jgi:uncharacterized protein (DUF1778 family)
MPKQTATKHESRLSIRANPSQKAILSRAATANHMNVSQFVLGASLREAEQMINDETSIMLSAEEYTRLAEIIDAATPASPKPRLQEAMRQTPVWDV